MIAVSLLPHAVFGRNDPREDAPHFMMCFADGFGYLTL